MKKLIITTVGAATITLSGCVHQLTTADASKADANVIHSNTYQRYKCPHAKVKSILGLTNEVLADTNRFTLAASDYGHQMKLVTPVFGCMKATVRLNEIERSHLNADITRTTPHKLRGVEFSRVLPDGANSDDLFAAGQAICREIADLLDIEAPKIELVDLGAWRKENARDRYGRVTTHIYFDLADKQEITVRLTEGLCVVRAGQVSCMAPPTIEVDVTFDKRLYRFPGIDESHLVDDNQKPTAVDRFVDIGSDYSETFAKVLREEVSQKEKTPPRRKKAAVQDATKKETPKKDAAKKETPKKDAPKKDAPKKS